MLGLRQRQWLMREMQDSNADFFFVVSSVNFMIPHIGGGGVRFDEANKDDAWTVFLDERETLIDFWDGLGKPVFVLTGDLHNSFAIKVTDRVWEFASGPHNSVNHRPQRRRRSARDRSLPVWPPALRNPLVQLRPARHPAIGSPVPDVLCRAGQQRL